MELASRISELRQMSYRFIVHAWATHFGKCPAPVPKLPFAAQRI
jgi:hypothetical protein